MYPLPSKDNLPIYKLLSCFNNTTATYKFYWLLAIIDEVERGRTMIPKRHLFAGMVSHAWYTVHYFHIGFGKFDLLGEHTKEIQQIEQIPISKSRDEIREQLNTSVNSRTRAALNHFDRNVPHWFLSPWFPRATKAQIYKDSHDFSNRAPYSLDKEFISINLLWSNYFQENAAFIRSFCFWHLAIYLQAKNPNVPDIPNKLVKPPQRSSLNKQRDYWNHVFQELKGVSCIYTHQILDMGKYAVEHFIPYSFVSHDLMWNLIPADPSSNSSKGDKLPLMEKYFEPFFVFQKRALQVMTEQHPRHPLLEDYLTIFPDLNNSITAESYRERIQPLVTIAANNGFEFMTL